MSSAAPALSGATFDEEVAGAEVPVLVEFWAEWCPPCRVLAPILDEIRIERGERLRVFTVDSDAHHELATRFEVLAVPTLLLFSEGALRQRLVGARSKARLVEELDRVLGA